MQYFKLLYLAIQGEIESCQFSIGDAEKMLLCDGCDRGFHMYCLKPPVKKIPEGDWFCTDCRPKEPKRMQRSRRRPTKLEEFVDDVEEDAATEQTDEVEDAIESDEEEDDEESVEGLFFHFFSRY